MKNAVIVHGKPTRERYVNPDLPKPHQANWLPWLGSKLTEKDIDVNIPAMPEPYFPNYEKWLSSISELEINDNTALIGHSTGAEFILRFLSVNPEINVESIALVAPWTDKDKKYGDFSSFKLDRDLGDRVGRLTIINSYDDSQAIQDNSRRLFEALPTSYLLQLSNYGHFMIGNNMTGPEFPELLDELLK